MKERTVKLDKLEFISLDGSEPKKLWKGEAVLSIPKYKERNKMVKDLGFILKDDGKVEFTDGSDHYDIADKMYDILEKHLKSISATHTESKEKFEDIESLYETSEGSRLGNALGNMVLNGVKLGNG